VRLQVKEPKLMFIVPDKGHRWH